MDNDLERSLRFLEDSLTTPTKGLFKSTPKAKSKKELEKSLNLSLTMAPSEIEKLLQPPGENTMRYNNRTSLFLNEASFTGTVIQSGAPWKNTVNNLFIEFAEILQIESGGSDILATAADLARCCSDTLKVVQTLKSSVNISQIPEEGWLENERNNWRLLFVLYQDRLQANNELNQDLPDYLGTSEKNCIKALFKRDSLVRESQLVIDWLERNALEKDDPILHHSDWIFGWEHTIHQLLAPEAIAIGSNVDIIKNIHPDASNFQKRALHHLDGVNEKKLCQRIFTEIRCGNLEEAQQLCCSTGHPWRAALLEGWKLFHNPNIKDNYSEIEEEPMSEDGDCEFRDAEGNASRDLWKKNAIEYCKKPNLNVYEKAAVASLCGYLEAMLPVCNSWEDYLWAYMRTIVDIRVESEIRDCIIKNYLPLPEEYWGQKLSLSEIFTILESSNNPAVQTEAFNTDHVIQKHIILDEIPQLMSLLDRWSEDSSVTTQSLRFFAHLVLFFDDIGEAKSRLHYEKVLEAYITRLSEMNDTALVAFYVSKLGKRKQVPIYAKHLEKILDRNGRELALKHAEDYDLDIFAITKRVAESICSQPNEIECSGNLQSKITQTDELKISALDWLIFYEEQRVEALLQTNALIFKFLTLGKLDGAHLAIGKIPPDSVKKIESEAEASEEIDQIVKEHLSYKTYLEAQEAFNEWFSQFGAKPQPPPKLPETAQFTEKVAHEHRVSQHNAELERWKLTTAQSAQTAKTLLYNVLLFPRGWLVGAHDAEYLRSVCIPEIVLLLYSVLSESGMHAEAVSLADLVASEKYGLYKVYSKEKLGEILEKICESSVALLNAQKDPWGNAVTA